MDELTVEREIRGGTAHWVHVRGPIDMDRKAPQRADAEARKWARELGKARAYSVSGGGDYNMPPGTFRYSVCYGFGD